MPLIAKAGLADFDTIVRWQSDQVPFFTDNTDWSRVSLVRRLKYLIYCLTEISEYFYKHLLKF